MSAISVEWREAIRSFVAEASSFIAIALFGHLWMAMNIALAIHPLLALVYTIFPPLAVMFLTDLLMRFAAFSLLLVSVYLLSLTTLCVLFGRRISRLPGISYLAYLPFFVVWMPVASGEVVRAAGMYSAIVAAGPECYETSSFIASLHNRGEYAQAHAWMVKDAKRYIWSYSELRFVADSRPWLSGGSCR